MNVSIKKLREILFYSWILFSQAPPQDISDAVRIRANANFPVELFNISQCVNEEQTEQLDIPTE